MGFKPGNKLGGRPKGVPNQLTRRVSETAARLGIDPFEILLRFAAGDWKGLGYKSEKYVTAITDNGRLEKWTIDPAVRARAAQEAAQYILPKLRAIEQIKPNALDGMTPHQKLEAMKHAVAMLEVQTQKKEDGGPDDPANTVGG